MTTTGPLKNTTANATRLLREAGVNGEPGLFARTCETREDTVYVEPDFRGGRVTTADVDRWFETAIPAFAARGLTLTRYGDAGIVHTTPTP